MEEGLLAQAIRRHTCTLIDTVDPKDVIARLFQDHALSDEECEDILAAPTRNQRAWKLLYHLRHRHPQRKPFQTFVECLKKDHTFLVHLIEQTLQDVRSTDHQQVAPHKVEGTQKYETVHCRTSYSCQQEVCEAAQYRNGTFRTEPHITPSTHCHQGNRHTLACGNVSNIQLDSLLSDLKYVLLGGLGEAVSSAKYTEEDSSVGVERQNGRTSFQVSSSRLHHSEPPDSESDIQVGQHEPKAEWCEQKLSYQFLPATPRHNTRYGDVCERPCQRGQLAWQREQVTGQRGQLTEQREQPTGQREQPTGQREQVRGQREQVRGQREQPTGKREQVTGQREQPIEQKEQVTGQREKLTEHILSMVRGMPAANGGRKYSHQGLRMIFNKLSSLINYGHFDAFHSQHHKLLRMYPGDADLLCVVHYLEASTHLLRGRLDECEMVCQQALQLVPSTSNPSRVIVEIFSVRCWMHLKQNKLNTLEYEMHDAIQIIAQDPFSCAGKAVGWLYVDKARSLLPLLSGSNLARSYRIRQKAIACLEKALEQFSHDDTHDGPYGFYFATVKLASIQLACGDLMQTTDLQPSESDIIDAAGRLRQVEVYSEGHPLTLTAQFCMAMSDLHYRKQNLADAVKYAEQAYSVTTRLGLHEETRWALARRDFHRNLQEQSPRHSTLPARRFCLERNSSFEQYQTNCVSGNCYKEEWLRLNGGWRGSGSRGGDSSVGLRFFVRLWFLCVLLCSCWLYASS